MYWNLERKTPSRSWQRKPVLSLMHFSLSWFHISMEHLILEQTRGLPIGVVRTWLMLMIGINGLEKDRLIDLFDLAAFFFRSDSFS